ncbi:transcriptional regulator [Caulobacter zeae]|uniref:Transcriptional regulator n=1 Tax=Caulobacter zeae TaxID=2055137 RepID=A0A2N5DFR4_9CAUL|nr:helix-turn-helix transcriptional regulator [Caulobacter zeae]PLR24877.1 transcriptional regulator [Caulobacter zeae]
MIHDLPIGLALRRFRRLNAVKQGAVAQMLAVSQGTVSRWESGEHEPDEVHRERIAALIAARAGEGSDAAIRRLVETSSQAVHLVCDATHRLLAASPSRLASWQVDASDYLGDSLWRFASPEIAQAEAGLARSGWFERPYQQVRFETGGNGSPEIPVVPGLLQWETIPLADGRVGRLTTTID